MGKGRCRQRRKLTETPRVNQTQSWRGIRNIHSLDKYVLCTSDVLVIVLDAGKIVGSKTDQRACGRDGYEEGKHAVCSWMIDAEEKNVAGQVWGVRNVGREGRGKYSAIFTPTMVGG